MQYHGMIAGILNKLGKIGVIVGFCLGNAILTFVANGNTIPIITIREILIASLGLLIIPNNVEIDIEDIIGKTKYLPTTGGQLDGETDDTVFKLNSVSETISEIAKSYNEVADEAIESEYDMEKDASESFKEELLNNIEDFSDNLLYDDMIDNEIILDDIYDLLEKKENIELQELLDIFEKNNNYIIGIDDEENSDIKEDINKIVRAINQTYRINKLNIVWKQKEASNKKVLASQLRRGF